MNSSTYKKKVNKTALRWILQKSKSQLPSIILLVVIYGILAVIGVYVAIASKYLVNAATGNDPSYANDPLGGVAHYGMIFGGIVCADIFFSVLQRIFVFRISAKLEISYKTGLFQQILEKEFVDVSAYHSGELLNRLTSDIGTITGAIVTIIPQLTYMIVKLAGVFIVLVQISIPFTMVFVVGGALALFVASLYRTKMKNFHKKGQETDGKVRSFLQEIIASLLLVKSFDIEDEVLKDAKNLQQNNYVIRRKRNTLSVISSSAFSFVFMLGYAFGLIWGAYNIVHGNITYGVLTEIIALVSQIQGPISGLTGIFPTYFAATASAERIMEIESLPQERKFNKSEINVENIYNNLKSINFDNITFSYGRDEVLSNTSLKINKGDFVAIMGITGIGKSTLMKLLMSVFNVSSGEIYLDLKDNKKLYIDKNSRKMFAYVPQGNFLLSGTIRDNLLIVSPNATDEEIHTSLKIACADFVDTLPSGLDTILGERGIGLSEGQVQRLAIARAILTKSPILLLDECTSALDEETEKRLLQNLVNLQNKTCMIITHKKAALSICNKEVCIEDKKIIVKEN